MQLKATTLLFISVLLLIVSCTKSNNVIPQKNATIEEALLTSYKWLIATTNTAQALSQRDGAEYIVKVIINDTSLLDFKIDSSFESISFSTEDWTDSGYLWIPNGIPPPVDYLPRGSSYYTGNFSFNPQDSLLTRNVLIAGTYTPTYAKILLLTKDSLRIDETPGNLADSLQSILSYNAFSK
ncbi:hypothetical protein BH10BAC2_BH10BAC2_24600 [soil metagenome]